MPDSRTLCRLAAALLVLLLVATAPAAATQHEDDRSFVVDLQSDGSATVTVRFAYDLNSDSERTAFQNLQRNESRQQQFTSTFLDRMQRVAAAAENSTGRSMSVSNPQISFETRDDGQTGVVSLSITWTGLAATTENTLVVSQPFASDYQPDRRFVVRGPDGYRLTSVTPSPAQKTANSAVWTASADLSGFEATFVPAESAAAGTDKNGSGFGAVAGLLALAATGFLARRRR